MPPDQKNIVIATDSDSPIELESLLFTPPYSGNGGTPNRKKRVILLIITGMIGLLIIISFQANLPKGRITYQAPQLAGGAEYLRSTGFYDPQTDESGNHYLWTKGQVILSFDSQTPHLYNLIIEARSAALAGGLDTPVQILVNGTEVGQFHPDPYNQAFQTFQLTLTPNSSSNLSIQLRAKTFQPVNDKRILGTMVKSVSVEIEPNWPKLSALLWLVAGLMVLAGLLWLIVLVFRKPILRYVLWMICVIGFGLILAELYWLAKIERTLISRETYAFWMVGAAYLALWWWAIFFSIGIPSSSLAHRIYYHLGLNHQFALKQASGEDKIVSIQSLTGLRYLAALLVFMAHLPYTTGLPQWLASVKFSGYNGVALFYVLSGFVICYNYYERISTDWLKQLKPFFVSRFARIYPGYLVVFIFYYTASDTGFHSVYPRPPGFGVLVSNLTLMQAWSTNQTVFFGYVGSAWSVSVEVFLYLAFPLITCLVLKYCQETWQLLTFGAIAYAGQWVVAIWLNLTQPFPAGYYWAYVFPVINLTPFILGCIAARIYMKWLVKPVQRREQRIGKALLYGAIVAVALVMLLNDQPWLVYPRWGATYVLFFAIIVFCLARYRSYLGLLLSHKFLVLLGEASYSFYLWHVYFLDANRGRLENAQDIGAYIYGFMVLVLLTATSVGLFLMIETPSRRFIRRIANPGLLVGRK